MRKVEGSDRDEEVPPPILISLVEAVITNRVDEFTLATGISVGDELQTQIRPATTSLISPPIR